MIGIALPTGTTGLVVRTGAATRFRWDLSMGYHPRIESKKISTFQTTRSRCSELWLVNNPLLESDILGYAAKYSDRYGVKLFALAIEGNHIQFPARFPKANRAHFMRDFNSSSVREATGV